MKPLTVNFKFKTSSVGIATRTESTYTTTEKENCIFYKDGSSKYMLFNGIVRWEYDMGITFEI